MTRIFLALLIAWAVNGRAADDDWEQDLREGTQQASGITEQLQNPGNTPEKTAELQEQKKEVVNQIAGIADARPDNVPAQLAVSKSLASVEEAPRAIPYAERGLALAEASGDAKLVRSALLTGSDVYAKAGQYDLARARVQRVLEKNPRDIEAMALYMQVKGRGTALTAAASGGAKGGASGSSGTNAGGYGAGSTPEGRDPGVAMTSASSIEAQKQIALGWSRIKLDPAAALKNFEAAITADPTSAAVRVQRSKARLASGDAAGALGDSDDAIRMEPRLGEAYAARAEAKRALGRAEAELVSDYEAASNLDGRFTAAYKEVVTRLAGAASGSAPTGGPDSQSAGRSAPDGIRGLLSHPPKKWGLIALICALAATLGGILVPLLIRKRRSESSTTPAPTPRP